MVELALVFAISGVIGGFVLRLLPLSKETDAIFFQSKEDSSGILQVYEGVGRTTTFLERSDNGQRTYFINANKYLEGISSRDRESKDIFEAEKIFNLRGTRNISFDA